MEDGSELKVMILFTAAGLGGAEKSLSRMAMASRDLGIRYVLATLGGEGAWSSWIRRFGVEPLVVPVLKGSFPAPRELPRFVKMVRRTAPRIIYVVGVRAAVLVRVLKPILRDAKVVHAIRTTFQPGSELSRTFRLPERALRRLTDGYIANSASGAATLARLAAIPPSRVHVIPNGIAVPEGSPPAMSRRAKEIAVVANLTAFKGHREFLGVVQAVHRAHPDAVFNFIGRDDLRGEIQREVTALGLDEIVRFKGFQEDVWPWLLASRVFVLPSRETEGAPTAILEAQAAGVPVVAFAIGGIPGLVRDGVDGRLIRPRDDEAMAAAIVALLDDDALAAGMGLAGRQKILQSFTLTESAERHAAVWRALTATG